MTSKVRQERPLLLVTPLSGLEVHVMYCIIMMMMGGNGLSRRHAKDFHVTYSLYIISTFLFCIIIITLCLAVSDISFKRFFVEQQYKNIISLEGNRLSQVQVVQIGPGPNTK